MKRSSAPWGLLWLLAAIVGLILVLRVQAASTLTVTTTDDSIANDGKCSLREAIIAANTDSAVGGCPAGSGADTIVFDSSLPVPAVLTLTHTGAAEDAAMTGDLDIVGTLTISGAGIGDTILDGYGSDRIFEIRPGAHVTITGMTIRNGNSGADVGGGIKVLGTLTMSESRVESNHGDGIHNQGSLTLNATDVASNTAGYGIYNAQGTLSYNVGLVSGNQSGGIGNAVASATLDALDILYNSGSGVHNTGSTLSHLTMHRCVVMSNTATSGAGIFNSGVGAIADIHDTRISGNTASAAGGGLLNDGIMSLDGSVIDHNQARSGGGIDHLGGNLHLTNDTLSGNHAVDNGGGLYNRANAILTNVTFSANTASGPGTGGNIFNDTAQLSIGNTIVALADVDGNCFNSDGFLNSLGYNLDSANTCGFAATGDLVNTDPLLGPLQDNGGSTFTHALLPGSPAIDAADPNSYPPTDQRGMARPQGAGPDIGAYESVPGGEANLAIAKVGSPGAVSPGAPLIYALSVSNAGPAAATAVTVTDVLPAGMAYVSASGSGWSCSYVASTVTCTRPELAVGTAPEIMLSVAAPLGAGPVRNTASVSAATPDPQPANDSSSVEITVGYIAHLPLVLR